MAHSKIVRLWLLFLCAISSACHSRSLDDIPAHSPSRFLRTSTLSSGRNPGSSVVDRVSFRRYPRAEDRRYLLSADESLMRASSTAPPPQNSTLSTPAGQLNGTPESPKHDKKPLKVGGWFSGIAIGTVAGAASAMLLLVVFERLILKLIRGPGVRAIIYQHKWVKAKSLEFLNKKDCFEGLELLGEGGCGKVYRAVLKDGSENGKVVAIKKVTAIVNVPCQPPNTCLQKSYDLTKHSRQINAELTTIGHVRHRNLVSLLAYVPQPEAHLLIYEYMENNSLRDALIKVAKGSLNLSWPMRYNIAVGVITGLKYLHFDCKPCIVHRDVKPANVLLDADFEAHLSDFGLAKVVPDAFTHFSTENIAGTVGYIAPEYHQTLKFTPGIDIFSYGVLMCVLITGKEPTSTLFSEVQTNMGMWITDLVASGPEAASAYFDPSIRNQGFDENIYLALKLSVCCVAQSPSNRPSSVDVLAMLRQIPPPQISPVTT